MKHLADQALRFLRLADRDVRAFKALKISPDVDLPTVCFHAQQAVEKYLKAALIAYGVEPARTHDLNALVYELQNIKIELPARLEEISKLNLYAVIFRYDDTDIEILTRDEAENIVIAIRNWAEEFVKNQKC
jgi:HEPN domain-containing protein